jgi:hypothetical protein
MISGVVGLNPREGVGDNVSSLTAGKSLGDESAGGGEGCSTCWLGIVASSKGGGIVVVQAKSLEHISHSLIGVGVVDSGGISGPDGLHSVVGVLMLAGGHIVKVRRFIADLVLGPGIGMIPWVVRFDPREAVRLHIGGLRAWELGLLVASKEGGRITSTCCWSVIGSLKG